MQLPLILRKIRRKPIIFSIILLNVLIFSLYFTLFNYGTFTSSLLSSNHNNIKINNIKIDENSNDKNSINNNNNKNNINKNKNSMSSLLDKFAFLNENQSIINLTNILYKKLFTTGLTNSNWRFANFFINSKISLDISYIMSYVNKRKSQHFYDPRITLSVYLSYLNDNYINNDNSIEIPFSWDDWVDLSYLNNFIINSNDDNKFNCEKFFHNFDIDLDFEFDSSKSSIDYFDKSFCLDNDDFFKYNKEISQFKNKNLLPGFNFKTHISEKSNFVGQLYNAKSYLLSFAEPPHLIYFLNDNGTYHKAKPYQSNSMMDNNLFDSFARKSTFKGFNPINEIENLSKNYLLQSINDFKTKMINSNSYELSIPENHFTLNTDELFHYLYAKEKSSLEENEKSFIDSIDYSKNTKIEDVEKYFKEVEVKWYADFNGHQIRENGAHYDWRFFSGFLSEMPDSKETTFHSPYFESLEENYNNDNNNNNDDDEKKKKHSIDSDNQRQTIILSHMVHTLFTLTFHEGLFMFPAHGSLLAWYFNSLSFPYDEDEDVQMPISDLAEFCLKFNNSMIVENPKYGMGKYFVDCTSSLTHRGKELGENNIDARVIDIDSGMYIDITGLSVSSDKLNKENLEKFKTWIDDDKIKNYPIDGKINDDNESKELSPNEIIQIHKDYQIYNCRNDHFYSLNQLSPVRLTLFEGAPTFVVASNRSLIEVLDVEYGSKSHTNGEFRDWFFLPEIKMWVHANDMKNACNEFKNIANLTNVKFDSVTACYKSNKTVVLSELIKNSVYDITLQSFLKGEKSYRPKFNILSELYRDNNLTSAHTREMDHFHGNWEWDLPSINDQSNIPNDWEGVAKWMLEDHSPPRLSMLDYLIFTEREDHGIKDDHVL